MLVCLVVAVAAVLSSRHSPTAPTGRSGAASPSEVSSSAVSRVEEATDAAGVAATAARSALNDIPGIPTLTNVAAIINPYVTSLQRYGATLAGNPVPGRAQTTIGGVRSLVRQDAQYLSTVNTLPSLDLGTYLAEVSRRSAQLQMAFSEVKGALHAPTS